MSFKFNPFTNNFDTIKSFWKRDSDNGYTYPSTLADNVGIGIATPASKLHVNGATKIGTAELTGGNAGFFNVELRGDEPYIQAIKMIADRDGQAVLYGFNGTAIGSNTKNVGLYGWASGATTNLGIWIDSGDALFDERVLVTGDVGIGTTSPDTKLQVVGDVKLGDDNTNYASFASDGELSLHGTARVKKDLWIDANGIKAPGAHPATFVEDGLTGCWEFADQGVANNQEQVSGTIKIPDDMDLGIVTGNLNIYGLLQTRM